MGSLPKLMVVKSDETQRHVYYMNNKDENMRGFVSAAGDSVFDPFAKIQVETSKVNNKYVHLRFCHSNKYWGLPPTGGNMMLNANSDQQVEDRSDRTCTLFEPNFSNGVKNVTFTHIQSGGRVRVEALKANNLLFVDTTNNSSSYVYFSFVDWDTLVKLPKYITLKGDNGKYFQGVGSFSDILQLSGEDFNHEKAAYEVFSHPDGHIRIKYVFRDAFLWRGSSDWILYTGDMVGADIDTVFWPVKIDDNTIALRSAGNNLFCRRQTGSSSGRIDSLNSGASNITNEARLIVEELVLEKSIYNVRYRMEDARIYDEEPFVAGTGTAINNSNIESFLAIRVSYEDTTSRSFTHSASLTVGVTTSISTGIPFIAEGKIEVSTEASYAHEWGTTSTESKTSEATYTVQVPPMSRVIVNYVATKGKCSVPFSYIQRDKRSSNGSFVESENIDGIYNGVNYYSYHFEQHQFETL